MYLNPLTSNPHGAIHILYQRSGACACAGGRASGVGLLRCKLPTAGGVFECTDGSVGSPPGTASAAAHMRHGAAVSLRTAELRQGMLQGYRELLGIAVPAHTICVQARLVSGASQLLTDETPLTDRLLGAVSFYVWADVSPADLYGPDVEIDDFAPPPASEAFATPEPVLGVDTPSVAQLKNLLGADLTGR